MDSDTDIQPPVLTTQVRARDSRRRPLLAVVAVALIVALSITLFNVLGFSSRHGTGPKVAATSAVATATPSTVATMTPSAACSTGQNTVHLPKYADLFDVSMVSPSDGWAVGQIWDASQSGQLPQTLIMHLQNCQWLAVGPGTSSAALLNVVMTSPDDGWAVGATALPSGPHAWQEDQLILLHYTGGKWQRVYLAGSQQYEGAVLRMISPGEGWLLLPFAGALYHYLNGAWTQVPLPKQLHTLSIADLAASASGDCWIVGDTNSDRTSPVVAHYTAGHWAIWTNTIFGGHPATLGVVRIASPQSVWVLGTYSAQDSQGYYGRPLILHYDGAHWSIASVANLGTPAPDFSFWTTDIVAPNGDVTLLGSESLRSVPDNPNVHSSQRTVALRCTGTTCQAAVFPLENVIFVTAVSLVTPTQGTAVGCEQTSASGPCAGALLAYDNGNWSILPGQ